MLKTEKELLQIAVGLWVLYMFNITLKTLMEVAFGLWLFYLLSNLISNRQPHKFSDRLKNKPIIEIVDPVAEAAERKRICRAIGMPEPMDLSDSQPLVQPDQHSSP